MISNNKHKSTRILLSSVLLVVFLSNLNAGYVLAATNNYEICVGAQCRWDVEKYYWTSTIGGNSWDYTLQFDFTNFWDTGLGMVVNGTIDDNETVYDGELTHHGRLNSGLETWSTGILDDQGEHEIYIYMICIPTEIESTKTSMQGAASGTWLDFAEHTYTGYNFTLSGTYVDGVTTTHYYGEVVFNEDLVLEYIEDDLKQYNDGSLATHERYIWDLTYTAGTGDCANSGTGPGDDDIPGYSFYLLIGVTIFATIMIVLKKKRKIYVE